MFSWFKTFIKEQHWRLVKTIEHPISITGSNEKGILFFHLFESDIGNRKISLATTISGFNSDTLKEQTARLNIYQTKIYRWEMGRVDPDIPRYDQVPEEDCMNVLKGSI